MPPHPTASQSRSNSTSNTPYSRPSTSNAQSSTSTSLPTPSDSQTKQKKKSRRHLAPINPDDLPKLVLPTSSTSAAETPKAKEQEKPVKESRNAKRKRQRSNQSTATEGSQPLANLSLPPTLPTAQPQPNESASTSNVSESVHTETTEDVMKRLMAVTTSTSPKKRHGDDKDKEKNKIGSSAASSGLSKIQIMQKREDSIKYQTLQRQMARMREEKDREAEGLRKKVRDLEENVEKMKEAAHENAKVIEGQEKLKETLKEGVTCNVCFETYNDPHILSCGHIACKNCLVSWFKTAGAYVHELPDPIPADMDTSHRTKLCHVCRTHITRRPARMYHLRHILEPLGIDSHIPTASQELTAADDVWTGIFPVDKEGYRLRDEDDGVSRCPECFGEVMDAVCQGCGVEFSDDEDELGDWESGLGSDMDDLGSDIDEDEALVLLGSDHGDGDGELGDEELHMLIDDAFDEIGEPSESEDDRGRFRGRNNHLRENRGGNGNGITRGRRNVPIQIQHVIDDLAEEESGDEGRERSGSEVPLDDMGRYAQGYEDDEESGSESYEGSFIDDGEEDDDDDEDDGRCDRPSEWMDEDLDTLNGSDDEDEEDDGARRVRRRGVTDEEAESPVIRAARPGRRRAPRITSDSE